MRCELIAVGLVAALLSGCSSREELAGVPLYGGEANADDAALEGVLVRIDRCVFVRDNTGGLTLPAFPASHTAWHASEQTLTIGASDARIGDRVRLAGSAHPVSIRTRWNVAPRATCVAGDIWFSGDHITQLP